MIVFRVDSSFQIGSGHVMRCLTLADEFRLLGFEITFVCRVHQGNLNSLIESRGYQVFELGVQANNNHHENKNIYSEWLGAAWTRDANDFISIIKDLQPDIILVDHYALDYRWEHKIKLNTKKLVVIDDLANRPHFCDILIDQTLNRKVNDYRTLVPKNCRLLLGTSYAMLRPDFREWRNVSIENKKYNNMSTVLISLGGVDRDNITSDVMRALSDSEIKISSMVVIMGKNAPHLEHIKQLKSEMKIPTIVLSNIDNMAELMAKSDFAIGAAGATSWERCCMGLPTFMVVLADNQKEIASQLEISGAICLVNKPIYSTLVHMLKRISKEEIERMSWFAKELVDGYGASRVVNEVLSYEC